MRARPSLLAAVVALALLLGSAGWHLLRGFGTSAVADPIAEARPERDETPLEQRAEAAPIPPTPVVTVVPSGSSAERERCLALVRDEPDAARSFAAGWEQRGGGEAARHCAALALLANGEPMRAAERLEALASASTAAPAARAALFAQALQAWTLAGDPNRAYAAATMGLILTPSDPDLLLDRAVTLGNQSRHRESLADLEQVLKLAPDRVEAWVLRATALRRSERPREAEGAVERAIALDPESAEALLERGILRLERGDRAGANADWRRAIAVAPDTPAADLAQQNLALNEAGPSRR